MYELSLDSQATIAGGKGTDCLACALPDVMYNNLDRGIDIAFGAGIVSGIVGTIATGSVFEGVISGFGVMATVALPVSFLMMDKTAHEILAT